MKKSISKFYLQFYKGSYNKIAFIVALSIIQSILVIPIAWLLKHTIDNVIPSGNTGLMTAVGLLIIFIQITNNFLFLWVKHLTLNITKAVNLNIRSRLLDKLYSFSQSFLNASESGNLHAVLVHDTGRFNRLNEALVAKIIPAFFMTVALCLFLLYLSPPLFLILLGMSPFLYLTSRISKKVVEKHSLAYWKSIKSHNQILMHILQIFNLTRIQTAEALETARHEKKIHDLAERNQKMIMIASRHTIIHETFIILITVLTLIIGGRAVAYEQISFGALLSFFAGLALLRPHLQSIYSSIPQIIEGRDSLEILHEMLQNRNVSPYRGEERISAEKQLQFESVYFRYGDEDPDVLKDIDLSFQPHTISALVGANGSGKTTILWLILGLYRPQKGRLTLNGIAYDKLDITYLRRQIGVVLQEPTLFPGTILENISYGCPNVSQEDIIRAAEISTAHKFIKELPQEYQTHVGELGVTLSGGQRQRIAIARALLRNPKMLILDEPTNHLDNESADKLLQNLMNSEKPPTTLIITHNRKLAKMLDKIYYLKNGRLIEAKGRGDISPGKKLITSDS